MERRKNDSVCSLWHLHGKREAEATKNSMMEQLYEKNKDNTETSESWRSMLMTL